MATSFSGRAHVFVTFALVSSICAAFDLAHAQNNAAEHGSAIVNGNVGRDVIIINGGSTDNIPQEFNGEGARWIRAKGTVDILDGKVSITVGSIYESSRRHVVDIQIRAPRRKDVTARHLRENAYAKFEYGEQIYRVEILDVKLDDQRVLLRVKQA